MVCDLCDENNKSPCVCFTYIGKRNDLDTKKGKCCYTLTDSLRKKVWVGSDKGELRLKFVGKNYVKK